MPGKRGCDFCGAPTKDYLVLLLGQNVLAQVAVCGGHFYALGQDHWSIRVKVMDHTSELDGGRVHMLSHGMPE